MIRKNQKSFSTMKKVIAEATKLQSQVLESIIGTSKDGNNAGGDDMVKNGTSKESSELMTDAEKQIKMHKSEKETFSKGIASIIFKAQQVEVEQMNPEVVNIEQFASFDEITASAETIQQSEVKTTEVKICTTITTDREEVAGMYHFNT